MSNPFYEELVLKPQRKYEQAKHDIIDAAHSIGKAMNSLGQLTQQQREELLAELVRTGVAAQCLNCMMQNGNKW